MPYAAQVVHLEGLGEGDDSRQSSLLVGRLAAEGQVAQRTSCVVLHPLLTCTVCHHHYVYAPWARWHQKGCAEGSLYHFMLGTLP